MKKTIMVATKEDVCDFCEQVVNHLVFTSECRICGKDICKNCRETVNITEYETIYLCPDCKNIDISEYVKNRNELRDIYNRQHELIEEGISIIDEIRKRYYE